MKSYKHILKSSFFMGFMSAVASGYIRFVYQTSRWRFINKSIPEGYWANNKPMIYAFWHNRLFLNVYSWNQKKPFHMLISKHSDGELIARVMDSFGIQTIGGSTKKGGQEAFRKMLKGLKKGESVGITPDGPRGPRFDIANGVLKLAQLSKCDIIPVTYSIQRRKVFQSWDRFIFALPFSKGCFIWGEPLAIPRKADAKEIESFKKVLRSRLMDICAKADAYCGHGPLE